MIACIRISSDTCLYCLIIRKFIKIHASHHTGRVCTSITGSINHRKSQHSSLQPAIDCCLTALLIGNDPTDMKITVILQDFHSSRKIFGKHKLIRCIGSTHKRCCKKYIITLKIIRHYQSEISILHSKFCVFSSLYRVTAATTAQDRSSGKCSVVRRGEEYSIIDMGTGVRWPSAALKELGLNISDCAGILVTHEHSDHVKGLATFLKKNPLPVYGADDTLDFLDANGIVPASCALRTLSGGEEDVGDFGVTMFPTSHDVPCVGYRIHTPDNKTMTIATDLGVLTPPVHQALSGCDLVALESNYDLHMLRSGRYPYYLRSRIESNRGHLSNDECSAKLLELIQEGCKKFALCHLSQENNTPALALQTMFNTLGAAGVVPEKDCIVQAQRRNEISPALTF